MVFSSPTFLFYFLPLFLLGYALTPTILLKNILTLLASLLFYAWGEPWFVLILLVSIGVNFIAARMIDARRGSARKVALILAVGFNLLLLGVFKYADFATGNLDTVLRPLGFSIPQPNLPLPLGISFFTFHCLSYIIDVYRRRFPANRNLNEVALYITLFPQLVAGPIVRYKTVARQLHSRRRSLLLVSTGLRIFIIGLAQKVLIADQVAPLADVVFDGTLLPTMAEAWLGLLAYTVQIYFDFAGYSSMAIGLGLVLGFTLPRNFRIPYASLSVTEFWRRWHMSLSAWLRDYLYIPLGGSRGGAARTYGNLVTVFVICGLWHGAAWTFLAWGVWHGVFLVVERLGLGRLLNRVPIIAWGYTLLVVMGGWVLFRAHDLAAARHVYAGLVGRHGIASISLGVHFALHPGVLLPLATGCLLAVLPRWLRAPTLPRFAAAPLDTAWVFGLLILAMVFVGAGTYSPFLYFRF